MASRMDKCYYNTHRGFCQWSLTNFCRLSRAFVRKSYRDSMEVVQKANGAADLTEMENCAIMSKMCVTEFLYVK